MRRFYFGRLRNPALHLHSQRSGAAAGNGSVVQLVRMPPCHGGGRGFESRPVRKGTNRFYDLFVPFAFPAMPLLLSAFAGRRIENMDVHLEASLISRIALAESPVLKQQSQRHRQAQGIQDVVFGDVLARIVRR